MNHPEREAENLIMRRPEDSEMADKNSSSSTHWQGGFLLAKIPLGAHWNE